ncbi:MULTISPECIES: MFS transporter [unclassified Crossiella]|uniref:MFS transporter n=1 Tax=unclassified Crossiella TaxID=2620835 RepID=UPI001FFE624C|nr:MULTISPECIES: MFS transporter [unclassified Crossiella]MCK2245149.1 MFS transporter [Crossiella sp. S99.2]MCK2258802.1 MFS transporter [Crossiella sp. S99.1]
MTTLAPRRRVGGGWIGLLTLANVGVWAAFFGPLNLLLGQQAALFSPDHKETVLALVTGLGAAVSVVANPLAGALSDRTRGRFGRRHPWTVGGALAGAAALVLLAGANSVLTMAIGWCLVQAAVNVALAALTAEVPDHVPVDQRGVVGGWVGLAQMLGVLGGTALATAIGGIQWGYLGCATLLVAAVLPFVVRSRDPGVAPEPGVRPGRTLARFWVSPRAHPDFAWAWLTRFLLNLGNAFGTLYLLFFLTDAVRHPDPSTGVLILTSIYGVSMVATTVLAGRWSDRVGRRKVFVTAASVVMAAALAVLVLWPVWPAVLLGTVVLGLGFGVYTSVDFALLTEVLPAAEDRAKDLGMINIASALPQVLAPAVAAPVLAYLGGYPALYGLAALVTLVGGLLVSRIRGVA